MVLNPEDGVENIAHFSHSPAPNPNASAEVCVCMCVCDIFRFSVPTAAGAVIGRKGGAVFGEVKGHLQ